MRNKLLYIYSGLLLFCIILVYHSTFVWLFERYSSADTYYSHGFLIPFVSGILIWQKRKQLRTVDWKYNSWGLVLIVFSLFLHFLSTLAEVFFISGLSILLLVFGISLFLFGEEATKKISFPLSFLIFMFPLPLVAINAISFPLKMLVTKSVVFILKTFGNLPIRNEGFQIIFPNASLIVENPCSGLRSLIVILALGSIFVYHSNANFHKKILLFLLTIPIALISNMVRVILLSLGVYIYGEQKIQGFFHDFTGYLVFIIAFFGLWLIWRKFQCENSE